MPKNVTQYDLLISCPGDIKEEIEIVEKVVERFNQQFTDVLGITIRTKHWKKSGFSQSGDKPQNLLNKQFALECDAAVAILWTKFGTPTDEYGSGTEEEIEKMLAMGKQVFMYFSDKDISPSKIDSESYNRVKEYREKYKEKGIYTTYTTNDEFEKYFYAHLSSYFLSEKKLTDFKQQRSSRLLLKGIDDNQNLSEEVKVQKFKFLTPLNSNYYLDRITELYKAILGKKVGVAIAEFFPSMSELYPKVKISEDERSIIKGVLEQLGHHVEEDFFDLGNLHHDYLDVNLINGRSIYKGSDDEKEKYKLIEQLYDTIVSAKNWILFEKEFSEKPVIRLALQNDGTDFDEDIEITLCFPSDSLWLHTEFPEFDNDIMHLVLSDYSLFELFGIADTAKYGDYESSVQSPSSPKAYSGIDIPFSDPDYSEAYEGTLDDIYCYNIYFQEDKIILKLKVDYIKQHTTIAFPSVLFLSNKVDEIDYSISSKNSPDIINAKIKIISD